MTSGRRRPVLVTGATGRVGRLVVDELMAAGVQVRALTRRPSEANLPPGVDVVGGDLSIPETLDAAFQDVGPVFLVWTASPGSVSAVVERLASHASRVVFLSAPHQTPHPFFQQPNPMAALHATIERLIAEARIPSTIIRPGMFASGAQLWWAEMIRREGVVRWPYGGAETAPIDERDIASVAARSLSDDAQVGRDSVLTGPESLSQAQQVSIIGDVIGRQIRFEELTPDEFRREVASAWPPAVVDMLLNAWGATMGHAAFVTSAVADITGSPARTFREWVADHAEVFR